MRTFTINIETDEGPNGDAIFFLVEVETLHAVTGDEITYRPYFGERYYTNREEAARDQEAFMTEYAF